MQNPGSAHAVTIAAAGAVVKPGRFAFPPPLAYKGGVMQRIALTLAYDGTDFSGWQFQPRDRTVQGVVEQALSTILEEPTRVHGSGRTDAGVHALAQIAHFDCADDRAGLPWDRALNALLPEDVRVTHVRLVADDFHARCSALEKTYEYTLWTHRPYCLPERRRFVWNCGQVDQAAMETAAELLTGERDFAAFQNVGTPVKSTVRTLRAIDVHPGLTEFETIWRLRADGFLKQMVRNLMGCLVACGQGRMDPAAAREILEGRDRSLAPATAPPQGLRLISVRYPDFP